MLRGEAGALGAVVLEVAFFFVVTLAFFGDGPPLEPGADRFLETEGDGVVDGDVGCARSIELC